MTDHQLPHASGALEIIEKLKKTAAARVRAGAISPALMLEGPNGSATLSLTFDPDPDGDRLLRKARLMATALAATACGCFFGTDLLVQRGARLPVIVLVGRSAGYDEYEVEILTRPADGSVGTMFPRATVLSRLRAADAIGILLGRLLQDRPTEKAVRDAWARLDAMGVSIAPSSRVLH